MRRKEESGFALLLVFLMAATIAIMMYSQLPRVAFESQRAKEQLLQDRGEQYIRGIQLYVAKWRAYPPNLDALEKTNNVRYLRRRYKDPMTGKDEWRAVHVNDMGVLTDSLVQKQTDQKEKPATFVSELPTVGSTAGTGGDAGQNVALRRRPSDEAGAAGMAGGVAQTDPQGQQGAPGNLIPTGNFNQQPNPTDPQPQVAAGQEGQPGQAPPTDPSGQPIQPGQAQPYPQQQPPIPGVPGQPQPFAPFGGPIGIPGQPQPSSQNQQPSGYPTGMSANPLQPYPQNQQPAPYPVQTGGMQAAPPQPGYPIATNPQANRTGNPNPGLDLVNKILTTPRANVNMNIPGVTGLQVRGGIAGFASKYEAPSIKVYNERQKYQEWEFVYDIKKDKRLTGAAAAMTPNQPNNQLGTAPTSSNPSGFSNPTGSFNPSGPNQSGFGSTPTTSPFGQPSPNATPQLGVPNMPPNYPQPGRR